ERFPEVPRIALTATADQATRNEIILRLQLEQARVFCSSFDRPNIFYQIVQKSNYKRQLKAFISDFQGEAGIVYCLSRKKTDQIASWLNTEGVQALAYHAGLPALTRSHNQSRFLREDGIVMVATVAFGMGIDKPDVRFVAHLDLPSSMEAYYQETGRAGRDGAPSSAWLCYGYQDVVLRRQMIQSGQGDESIKRLEGHKLNALLGLCETTQCRRQVMLGYFDEAYDKPCGHCDTCKEPVTTWDGTEAAQKAMSTIYRTGQRFGVGHLIDVLLAKDTEKTGKFGHDTLSTWGIGKNLTANQWRSVYRQLVAGGYLQVDMEGFGGLQLTEKSRPILQGKASIQLRYDAVTSTSNKQIDDSVVADPIWEALRAKRREIATREDIAPYMVFHDSTLKEMIMKKPRSLSQLAKISGVGQKKLEAFGAEFLEVIAEDTGNEVLNEQPGLSATQQETLLLHKAGCSIEDIVQQRELSSSTIYQHFAKLIEQGLLVFEEVFTLDSAEIGQIMDLFIQQDEELKKVKPLYQAFDGLYSYELLNCAKAEFNRLRLN
ncbi:MAG: RecQ family ATP-dependent DNA helicase, partial [Methylococcales bacterium]|nr:RecQ family ATP-dependent DNA helicase [Methylococcales bacterium]